MRFSRPDYDKPHRCPGWAGGGWTSGEDRCNGGSVRTRGRKTYPVNVPERERGEYPGERRWRFGRCTKCDVVTWPVALCHAIDPTWWNFKADRFFDRIRDSWNDYQRGEPLRWIYRHRWKRYRRGIHAWWACQWCDWEALGRRRPFDRWFATQAFKRHLRDEHPNVSYRNEALWDKKVQ